MKKFFVGCGAVIAFVVLMIALTAFSIGSQWFGLQVDRFLGREKADVRTDIYRNSRAYQEGSIRDIRRLMREFKAATPSEQESLRTIILQRADEMDYDNLPSDVRQFLAEIS